MSAVQMSGDEKSGNHVEGVLKEVEPDSMTVDELWEIHERIGQILFTKIHSEQQKLEGHLSRLRSVRPDRLSPPPTPTKPKAAKPKATRRFYPEVKPKYRSLKDPSQTWAGRGKQPRWLIAEMRGGKSLEDFLIDGRSAASRKKLR